MSADADNAKLRRRAEKINSEQKKIILQFIACTPEIIFTSVTPEFSLHHHQLFWQDVAVILNLFGPPRKTPTLWKKAWKDFKGRFRKNNVDVIDALNYVKSENAVNTNLLLRKAEGLTTNDDKMALRRAVWELVIDPLPEINISNFQSNEHPMAETVDTDLDDCSMSNDGESPDSHHELKTENSDDHPESLIVSVEEVTPSDNDPEIDKSSDLLENVNIESRMKNTRHTDSDSDPEILNEEFSECSSNKRPKLSNASGTVLTGNISTESDFAAKHKDVFKNGMKKGVLDELLSEVRKFNKIQAEKLAVKKSYIEYKKLMLKNSYITQKEIAKSQNLLATSVKTFIDNISFNS